MLRTNLSTRPFYNVRAVRALLGLAAVIVLAISAFNVLQAISLSSREGELSARANEALASAERMRGDARRIRAQVDPKELATVSAAALEANSVIEQRAFSWGRLLADVEGTLPDNVRVTRVDPRIDNDGAVVVSLTVEAQSFEDVSTFVEALERGGRFRNVLPSTDQMGDDDVIDAVIEGRYDPSSSAPSDEPAAATGVEKGARRD